MFDAGKHTKAIVWNWHSFFYLAQSTGIHLNWVTNVSLKLLIAKKATTTGKKHKPKTIF